MKKINICMVMVVLLLFSAKAQKMQDDPKMKPFIDNLIRQMTVTEKLGQLNLPGAGDITTGQAGSTDIAKKIREGKVGGLFNIKGVEKIREVQRLALEETRLKIPIIFGMDVIHGYQSVFPIPLGLSCSWDRGAIERSARVAAQEASADGINWTFSPMVDLSRDPRWGRVSEGNGEDPYLGGEIAKAMIRGYQGSDLKRDNTILSCVKHFALYGAPEAGRDYNTVDMSRHRMYNEYFPPYKAGVDAGAGSFMASFNEIDGVPATANKWLMTDVLRKQWGFGGFVVTDYTGVAELVEHGIGDTAQVSARALMAGIDMDMVSQGFLMTIEKSLKEGKVTMAQIDLAVRRILEAKWKLGLFEDPYRYCNVERSKKEVYSDANRAEARRIASESLVLMKNEGNILPLKRGSKILLTGPLADNAENMPGTWSVAALFDKAITVIRGLKEVGGDNTQITYVRGCNLDYDPAFEERAGMFGKNLRRDGRPSGQMIAEAIEAAKEVDVIVFAGGESAELSGECSSRTSLDIPQAQRDLLMALVKTGKPVVMILFTGRPLTLPWEKANIPAILNVWFPGSEAGYAIADVLFGDVNPSGKLTTTWPQNIGQVPLFYNHKNTGRPLGEGKWFEKFKTNYIDVTNDPLFHFGFGLSYTTFEYGDMKLSSSQLKGNQSLTVRVPVTNKGSIAGKEVVQLYIRDVVGSTTRPVKELKNFEKVLIQPGETKEVAFTITTEDLKFYNFDLEYDWEPGDFDIMIGTNSKNVQVKRVVWAK